MIEEQERQDNVQNLIEDCTKKFKAGGTKYSDSHAGLVSKLTIFLKNEREWVRKSAIKCRQEKVVRWVGPVNAAFQRGSALAKARAH